MTPKSRLVLKVLLGLVVFVIVLLIIAPDEETKEVRKTEADEFLQSLEELDRWAKELEQDSQEILELTDEHIANEDLQELIELSEDLNQLSEVLELAPNSVPAVSRVSAGSLPNIDSETLEDMKPVRLAACFSSQAWQDLQRLHKEPELESGLMETDLVVDGYQFGMYFLYSDGEQTHMPAWADYDYGPESGGREWSILAEQIIEEDENWVIDGSGPKYGTFRIAPDYSTTMQIGGGEDKFYSATLRKEGSDERTDMVCTGN